jgi:intracellular sulfur oxidation DsrE/DsrF family protein
MSNETETSIPCFSSVFLTMANHRISVKIRVKVYLNSRFRTTLMKKQLCLLLLGCAFAKAVTAQSTSQSGNVIPEFGKTYTVDTPDFITDTDLVFKAVFDVAKAPENPSTRNPYIETIARFLNMHEKAGVPVGNLKVRMAMHGQASYGLLKNVYYKEKFGVDNPNIALLEAIDKAGVEIILCGQTAGSRNLTKERRIPLTKLALSAMTILIQSQEDGYRLIAF